MGLFQKIDSGSNPQVDASGSVPMKRRIGASTWAGGSELIVLGWHNIEGTWRFPTAPGSGIRSFTQQLRALRRMTNVVPLDVGLNALREGRQLPPRAVALTFDDGYRDNLTLATPVLRELDLPATVYLVPGLLDDDVDPWWERLGWAFTKAGVPSIEFEGVRLDLRSPAARTASLERVEPMLKARDEAARREAVACLVEMLVPAGSYRADELFMNWAEACDIAHAGISIGSHTMRHVILSRETENSQREDLRESRSRLQETLDVPVTTLAYAHGFRYPTSKTLAFRVRECCPQPVDSGDVLGIVGEAAERRLGDSPNLQVHALCDRPLRRVRTRVNPPVVHLCWGMEVVLGQAWTAA